MSLLSDVEEAVDDGVDVPASVAWKLLQVIFDGQPTQTTSDE